MSWKGRLSTSFHSVRLLFNASRTDSKGIQDFITKHYSEIKQLNPTLPFLVRESGGDIQPKIYLKPLTGKHVYEITVPNWDDKKISEKLSVVVKGMENPNGYSHKDEENIFNVQTHERLEKTGLFKIIEMSKQLEKNYNSESYGPEYKKLRQIFYDKFRGDFHKAYNDQFDLIREEVKVAIENARTVKEADGIKTLEPREYGTEVAKIEKRKIPHNVFTEAREKFVKVMLQDQEFLAQAQTFAKSRQDTDKNLTEGKAYNDVLEEIHQSFKYLTDNNRIILKEQQSANQPQFQYTPESVAGDLLNQEWDNMREEESFQFLNNNITVANETVVPPFYQVRS